MFGALRLNFVAVGTISFVCSGLVIEDHIASITSASIIRGKTCGLP